MWSLMYFFLPLKVSTTAVSYKVVLFDFNNFVFSSTEDQREEGFPASGKPMTARKQNIILSIYKIISKNIIASGFCNH